MMPVPSHANVDSLAGWTTLRCPCGQVLYNSRAKNVKWNSSQGEQVHCPRSFVDPTAPQNSEFCRYMYHELSFCYVVLFYNNSCNELNVWKPSDPHSDCGSNPGTYPAGRPLWSTYVTIERIYKTKWFLAHYKQWVPTMAVCTPRKKQRLLVSLGH